MNKDTAYKYLNELVDTFNIKAAERILENKLNFVIRRNFTISLYTIWETYIKSILYDIYIQNEEVIYNEKFLKNYFEKVFTNRHTNKKFIDNLSNADVQKEILLSSNNLNWYVFSDFITLLGFEISNLKSRLINSNDISSTLKVLDNYGITPLYNEKNTEDNLTMKHLVGYINLIVEERNQISHNFSPYFSNNIDYIKAKAFVNFMKTFIREIDKFLIEELNLKIKEKGRFEEVLDITDVFKTCNADLNQTCIVEVTLPKKFKEFPLELYLKDNVGNIERCKVKSVGYKGIIFSKIIKNKPVAIELEVKMKVKKNRTYSILTREVSKEKMKIVKSTYDI